MKQIKALLYIFLSLFSVHLLAQPMPNKKVPQIPGYKKGEIIIKLKENAQNAARKKSDPLNVGIDALHLICKQIGKYKVEQFGENLKQPAFKRSNRPNISNILTLKYSQDIEMESSIKKLLETGYVEYAEPNYIGTHDSASDNTQMLLPNDYSNMLYWAYNDGTYIGTKPTNPASVVDADIDAVEAWDITTGSPNIIVAFLDSGIDPTNQEFAGRIVPGYDFVNEDADPADDHSHGTNVTGLATMTGNNNFGLAGVDWQCKIMPVKVLNANNGITNSSDVAEGLYYAVDNGARIINMSLGFNNSNQTLQSAIQYAYNNNVTVVASMGNLDAFIDRYPASYPETIAVGATDLNDHRVNRISTDNSWGSNYGNHIDLCAPGNSMVSARHDNNQSFTWWKGGTSQATPLVTGTASLLLSIDSTLTPEEIRTILRNTAEDQVGNPLEDTPGFDVYHGAGRLNAHQALLSINPCTVSSVCDDGDICTIGETYDQNCICNGGLPLLDTDNDGVCDLMDVCAGADDTLDDDDDGVCNANDICANGNDNIDRNNNGTPDACDACPIYNFNDYTVLSFYAGQDFGTQQIQDGGATLYMMGNAWKAIDINYTVTPQSVLTFDFKSTAEGEIHEIAFDNDLLFAPVHRAAVYGNQGYAGTLTNASYNGSGNWQSFAINLGTQFTGTFQYLVLTADDDANAAGNSYFRNITIFEDSDNNLACDLLCLPGFVCDDNNACTVGETYDSNCNCSNGIFADSDNDGVCDVNDQCPGGDDTVDINMDGIPDNCYLCPSSIVEINSPIILLNQEANMSITTNGTVTNGNNIKYHAGKEIEMMNGFEVELLAEFQAYIAPCN